MTDFFEVTVVGAGLTGVVCTDQLGRTFRSSAVIVTALASAERVTQAVVGAW